MKLHLILKGKWYDMIDSGVKTEEYREITPYWCNRLIERYGLEYWKSYLSHNSIEHLAEIEKDGLPRIFGWNGIIDYAAICFHRGYTNKTIAFEYKALTTGKGNPEWGAPNKDVFIIRLGKKLSESEEIR